MKGMLFYNGEKGFLLCHSVPNFVKIFTGNSFIYPDSGTERSQHILCTTIGKDALPIILQHIYISQPYIFPSKHIGQTFLDSDINAKNINDNEFEKNPVTTTLDFQTHGGLKIKIFTMSTSSKDLLWYEFSKEYSTQEFDVVTEFKGPALKTKENLRNVLTTRSSDGKKWGHGKDHAKYAISNSDRIGIGDINYRKIKSIRSGGIYSFISEKYVKAHRKIFKYECSGKRCADEKRP